MVLKKNYKGFPGGAVVEKVYFSISYVRILHIKALNITKLVQMIFSTWFGYFEYVGYLPQA